MPDDFLKKLPNLEKYTLGLLKYTSTKKDKNNPIARLQE